MSNLLYFIMPSLFANVNDAPLVTGEDGSLERYMIQRIKTMLRPFMLRRLKSQVRMACPGACPRTTSQIRPIWEPPCLTVHEGVPPPTAPLERARVHSGGARRSGS